jgi:hypothetical protein
VLFVLVVIKCHLKELSVTRGKQFLNKLNQCNSICFHLKATEIDQMVILNSADSLNKGNLLVLFWSFLWYALIHIDCYFFSFALKNELYTIVCLYVFCCFDAIVSLDGYF